MSFRKSALISVFFSLASGLLMLLISYRSLPRETGEGYAELTLDASFDDRSITARLSGGGIENYISESTQWVYLDDFGELERIPLDEYRNRVDTFDSRDDGYAERLRSFFIRDHKRRIFIPLSFNFSGTTALEKRLALLDLPPFSLEFLSPPRPLWSQGVLFIAAGALTLILSGTPLFIAALLPLFAALAYGGPSGFALSVVLIALFRSLLDPVREYFISRRYGKPGRFRGFREWLGSFKVLFLVPLWLAVYVVIACLGRLPWILSGGVFCSFWGVLGMCLWVESNRGKSQGHIRFLPVAIRGAGSPSSPFFRPLVPFALASLAALLLPLLFPSSYFSPGAAPEDPPPVGRADYETHIAFQSSFSFRSMGREGEGGVQAPSYVRYYLGEDGLIAGTRAYEGIFAPEDTENDRIPPFPLEKLVEFLENYKHTPSGGFRREDLVSVLIVLGLGIPGLFRGARRGRRGGKLFTYADKRIAA
jgi:hypothetical protein